MKNEALAEKKETLEAIKRLLSNPDYLSILAPHFEERMKFHVDQCRGKNLTPEKRAEHIEAAELAEALTSYLSTRAKNLETKIREAMGGK